MSGYEPDGQNCKVCDLGYYKTAPGDILCLDCTGGRSTSGLGATDESQCGEFCLFTTIPLMVP